MSRLAYRWINRQIQTELASKSAGKIARISRYLLILLAEMKINKFIKIKYSSFANCNITI